MKLSRIPGHEATVKHSFAFKQSTASQLQQYQELYTSHTGLEVSLKDVVEQMLVDFMAEDKAFQKMLKQRADAPAVLVAQPANASGVSKTTGNEVDASAATSGSPWAASASQEI